MVFSVSPRERFRAVMLEGDVSRGFPLLEWATWWHLTLERWYGEGLPVDADPVDFFGMEKDRQIWFRTRGDGCPEPPFHGGPIIANEADYEALLPELFPEFPLEHSPIAEWKEEQQRGESVLWFTFEGPFWFPRTLLGVEPHLMAFYEQPDLLHRIIGDLTAWALRVIDQLFDQWAPDFVTIAEDLSYNHGPMVSPAQMDEFMLPFYDRVTAALREVNVIPLVDSDGQIEPLIPWFERAGIEGILPLERMAGVDVNRIRANHPTFKLIGGFDKTVMHHGEEAIRREFARIRPAVLGGYYIPSVDHQTPPAVSAEDYRRYVSLLREFAEDVAREASGAAPRQG